MSPLPLRFGADVLVTATGVSQRWNRVAMVTNDAARLALSTDTHSRVALQNRGVPLVRLFGPEHGVGAVAEDGASVSDGVDTLTGLPVVSLYGSRMRPAATHLQDVDVVLFDVPDIGARFYTYAWTLWHVLHACADATVPLVVLDRPNPLGGVLASAEGPVLTPECRSFIGEDDIPVRHALTLGELALLWQREHCPHANLEVIACEGWEATSAWPSTGVPWVPTSPAMPSFDSAIWYPGTCLFEATNVSVGRGTRAPFATIGAPWMHPERVIDSIAGFLRGNGVRATPAHFTPTQGPHANRECAGVHLSLDVAVAPSMAHHVACELRPVSLGLHLLWAVSTQHVNDFDWATYPTAANPSGENHLARLVGRLDVASHLVSLDDARRAPTISSWTRVDEWAGRVAPILRYDRNH